MKKSAVRDVTKDTQNRWPVGGTLSLVLQSPGVPEIRPLGLGRGPAPLPHLRAGTGRRPGPRGSDPDVLRSRNPYSSRSSSSPTLQGPMKFSRSGPGVLSPVPPLQEEVRPLRISRPKPSGASGRPESDPLEGGQRLTTLSLL